VAAAPIGVKQFFAVPRTRLAAASKANRVFFLAQKPPP
jgi:hypothetical protein